MSFVEKPPGNPLKSVPYNNIAFAIICILLAVMPLCRGAVQPWAISMLQAGVLLAFILTTIDALKAGTPVFVQTPVNKPIIFLIIVCLISTLNSRHRPFAFDGFFVFLTYITAYYITQRTVKTRKHQRILVHVMISTALFLSLFGIIKRFGLNPFAFWEYNKLKYRPEWLASTYGNHNHLAGFLEMAFPFLAVLLITRNRSLEQRLLIISGLLILLITQALTFSRGGWVSMSSGIIFMGICLWFQGFFRSKLLLAGVMVIFLILAFFAVATTPLMERVITLTAGQENISMENRIIVWKGVWKMIQDNWALGTGPGTFSLAFPQYQPPGFAVLYKNAHNDYLQILSDAGVLIVPFVIWIMISWFKTGFKNLSHPSRQKKYFSLAAMAAVISIMVHSFSDFNLHIPANGFLFTAIIGIIR